MFNEALWIVSAIVFIVVEAMTSGLVSIWFAAGSLAALVLAVIDAPLWSQLTVFLLVSLVCFLFIRKFAARHIGKKSTSTNMDRIIGKEVTVTETVNNKSQTGKAKINDIEWSIKSSNGDIIEKGETATVEGIEGVCLLVKKADN